MNGYVEVYMKGLAAFAIITASVLFAFIMYHALPDETLVPNELLGVLWPWAVGAGSVMVLEHAGMMDVSRFDSKSGGSDD